MTRELAGSLILDQGKILLIYTEVEHQWKLPGGEVKEDESPTEAAVRQTREDIGVEVSLEKPFYSGEFQRKNKIFLWHCYRASIQSEPELNGEKLDKMEYFSASELDELELAPEIDMILPALRKI